MIRKVLAVTILFLFILSMSGFAQDKVYMYVGVSKCATCHKKAKDGEQLKIWEASAHSKAYKMLTSEEGLAKAKELGVKDPQKSEKCLTCHAPEFNKEKLWDKKFSLEDGVQCESCHGPGSEYKSNKIMKDHDLAVANGLLLPTEKTCMTCHKDNNPAHDEKFNYKEAAKTIAHPVPDKKKK